MADLSESSKVRKARTFLRDLHFFVKKFASGINAFRRVSYKGSVLIRNLLSYDYPNDEPAHHDGDQDNENQKQPTLHYFLAPSAIAAFRAFAGEST